jgi:hypothetical protein
VKRVLVTGLSSYWGGRLAQVLESEPEVETIVGVSTEDPTLALERTEFVRIANHHACCAGSCTPRRSTPSSTRACRRLAHRPPRRTSRT